MSTTDPTPSGGRGADWLEALEARHLANLTRSEVGRALRALSSCYVERRGKLASGAALEGAGKRAAFALFYGPLHFLTIDAVVHAAGLASVAVRRIHDLGCGTGVGGAAWALACRGRPFVAGADRSAWAVDEANWTYARLGVHGRATRADISSPRFRLDPGRDDAVLLGYALNELSDEARDVMLERVAAAVSSGASLLVVEPIGTRLGTARWWKEWSAALAPHGVLSAEWRFPASLPSITRDLARSAGLDPRELTARTLATVPRS